jgi:hypothetical protein
MGRQINVVVWKMNLLMSTISVFRSQDDAGSSECSRRQDGDDGELHDFNKTNTMSEKSLQGERLGAYLVEK